MPNYSRSGEEHLRSDPKVKTGKATDAASAQQQSIDIPKGVQTFDDDAHMRSDHKVLNGKDKPEPTDYRHDVPPGLQNFDDNGQKAGGTKYLGR